MPQPIELTLDDLGNLVIPPQLKSLLGFSPGMTLFVEKGDHDALLLSAKPQSSSIVEKEGLMVIRSQPLDELTEPTRHERENRVSDLLEKAGLL